MQKIQHLQEESKKTFRFAKNNITLQFVEKDKQSFIHLIHLDYVTIIPSNTSCGHSVPSGRNELMKEAIANAEGLDKLSLITQQLIDFRYSCRRTYPDSGLVFIVGRFLISMLKNFVGRLMDKRKVDISIKTFVRSLVNISIDYPVDYFGCRCFGVETTSFCGFAGICWCGCRYGVIGNLQNFAGGLIVLLFKPYKVGDWIESQGVSGTVKRNTDFPHYSNYCG